MKDHDVFWRLGALSDRQLLERLGSVLGWSRRLMAELIAHLGEVEERRLHLVAACSSMFTYCLKLGMTEDEAYRRIEVARLARRYPAIFPLLAHGQLSISAVALLKHHLSDENHLELLAAVTGKTVGQTRELIAARFPRPDVASSVRKLPERRNMLQPSLAMRTPLEPSASGTGPRTGQTVTTESHTGQTEPHLTPDVTSSTEVPTSPAPAGAARMRSSTSFASAAHATCATGPEQPLPATHSQRAAPLPPSSRIEPLSARSYKVQLTASAELARKLELAKDLMRHSHPGGELGPIVERALDLLIESLMQRRFGGAKQASPKRTSERARHGDLEPGSDVTTGRSTLPKTAEPCTSMRDTAEPARAEPNTAEPRDPTLDSEGPRNPTLDSVHVRADRRGELERASSSSYIPRSTRRAVVERDGLGCSWVDAHGVRCGTRAWLEYDHQHPRARGGGSDPENLRLLCRRHNRFAAERAYGRRHVEQTIAERRRARAPHMPTSV